MTYNVFSGTLKPYSINQTHVNCGQTAAWIKMPVGTEAGLGPGHFVLDGDPAPRPPKGAQTPCSAHICCSQTAGWINMSVGRLID